MGYTKEPGPLAMCNARYGADVIREIKLRLIGGSHKNGPVHSYLIWTPIFARFGHGPNGRKVVTPTAKKTTFNTHWHSDQHGSRNWLSSVKMTTTTLYEHLLACDDEIERMVAYTNRCKIVGQHRPALLMLDIDCHSGQQIEDAWATAALLDDVFDAPIYWELSTSGTGLHGYVLLLWPRYMHGQVRPQIRSDIRALEEVLAELTVDMSATCGEVKGAPMLFSDDGRTLEKMDSWAKVPRPQSAEQANRLLETMSNGVCCGETIQSARSALSSWRKKTATHPHPSPSAPPTIEGQVEGQSSNGAHLPPTRLQGAGSGDCAKRLYRGEDTFGRAKDFVPWYVRQRFRASGRLPSLKQAIQAYEEEGLALGNSDERCLAEVYVHVVNTFDSDQVGRRSIEGWLPHATEVVEKALRDHGELADLEADYQRRVSIARSSSQSESSIESQRRLKLGRLCKLLACLLWALADEEKQMNGFGKTQAQKLMKKVFGHSLHEREFNAGMAWLTRNSICELVQEAISTKNGSGRCRLYRLTIDSMQTPSQPS